MSLTPTQLSELQTIVETLRTEFPNSDDDLWQAAIRLQKGGLGPVTGSGGQPAFDAAVADIVLESEQISTVQGQQGGLGASFDVATFSVVPIEGELPAGSVGDVIYIDTAPNTYLATSVISLTPAGPNSVILSEVGTQVARTVSAANGGLEINNLNTGAGFERALTVSDMGLMLPVGTTANASLKWDGVSAWVEETGVRFLPSLGGTVEVDGRVGAPGNSVANPSFYFVGTATGWSLPATNTPTLSIAANTRFQIAGDDDRAVFNDVGIFIQERAAAAVDLSGYGQLFVRNDVPNVLIFRDDAGGETVLGAPPAGTDEQTLVYVGTTLTATDFFQHDNQNIFTIVDQFAATHNWNYNVGGGGLLQFTSSAIAAVQFPQEIQINEGGGSGIFSVTYTGNLVEVDASEASTTLRIGNTTTPFNRVELFQGTPLRFLESGGLEPMDMSNTGQHILMNFNAATRGLRLQTSASIYLQERAAANASVGGDGQIWVRNDSPNVLMYTDDAGTDFVISTGGGGSPFTTPLVVESAGNTTTEARLFEYALDNGTVVGRSGYVADSTLVFENIINTAFIEIAGDDTSDQRQLLIQLQPNTGGRQLYNFPEVGGSIERWALESGGIVALHSDGDTDTEVRRLDFNHQDGTLRGFFGHNNATTFTWDNRIDSGIIVIQARDAGSTTRQILNGDPDALTTLTGDTGLNLDTRVSGVLNLQTGGVSRVQVDGPNSRVVFNDFPLFIEERAAAEADVANFGQIWVENETPNRLEFTDDAGNDFYIQPVTIIADTDENVNNSTTLQDDDELVLSNLQAGYYRIDMMLRLRDVAVTGCGARISFGTTGVLSQTVLHVLVDTFSGAGAPSYDEIGQITDTFDAIGLDTGSGTSRLMAYGYFRCNAGAEIQLEWAQNTAQVGDLRREAGSFLSVTHLGNVT